MKKTRVVSIALAAIIAATGAMPSAGATAPEDFLKGYGYHVRLVPTEKCETVKENTKSFFENRGWPRFSPRTQSRTQKRSGKSVPTNQVC